MVRGRSVSAGLACDGLESSGSVSRWWLKKRRGYDMTFYTKYIYKSADDIRGRRSSSASLGWRLWRGCR